MIGVTGDTAFVEDDQQICAHLCGQGRHLVRQPLERFGLQGAVAMVELLQPTDAELGSGCDKFGAPQLT